MIVELFVAGGVAFWIITAFFALLTLWMLSDDGDAWPVGLMLLAAWTTVMFSLSDTSGFEWLTWRNFGWFALIYIPAGIAYMTLRWWLYVIENRNRFNALLRKYALDHGFILDTDGKIPAHERKAFTKWWKDSWRNRQDIKVNPKAWDRRHWLTTLAMWWPLSGSVWLVGDFIWQVVWDAWRWLVRMLSGFLTRLSNWVWPDVSDNFEELGDEELDDAG